MHSRRARANDDTGKAVFLYSVFNNRLTCLGTHILIVGGKYNALFASYSLCDAFNVDRCGDVASAPTYEYAYSLHLIHFQFVLFAVLSECTDNSLLGHIVIKNIGDHIGFEMILSLLSYFNKADSLYEFCGLDASGTSLYTCKARKTFVKRLGIKQFFNLTFVNHIDELMGMILHFVV